MPIPFSDQEKQRQLEHDVLESKLRIFRPHQSRSAPCPKEFPGLSDRQGTIAYLIVNFHWSHKRIGDLFKLSRARVSQEVGGIRGKLGEGRF